MTIRELKSKTSKKKNKMQMLEPDDMGSLNPLFTSRPSNDMTEGDQTVYDQTGKSIMLANMSSGLSSDVSSNTVGSPSAPPPPSRPPRGTKTKHLGSRQMME